MGAFGLNPHLWIIATAFLVAGFVDGRWSRLMAIGWETGIIESDVK